MQLTIFDFLNEPIKIKNKIRLIEMFGGIGCQAQALKNIGADFEHYKLVEIDKYAVKSYNAIHGTNFETKDIMMTHADDLEIVDKNLYTYLLTYSFPCTDLSLAGKQQGMAKGSGTKSGLLWEVERILNECKDLPQILLMENVCQVHNKKNYYSFKKWLEFLESKGYKNYYRDLNVTDYGIPQHRQRTYMVSILSDEFQSYSYSFPSTIPLKLRLKDLLEDEVDEKYYLSQKMIDYITASNDKWTGNNNQSIINRDIAVTINTGEGHRRCDASNYIGDGLPENYNLKNIMCDKLIEDSKVKEYDVGVVVKSSNKISKKPKLIGGIGEKDSNNNTQWKQQNRIYSSSSSSMAVTSSFQPNYTDKKDLAIRKLTPKECMRLMGFDDNSIDRAMKVNSNEQIYKQAGNGIVVQVLEAIFKNLY